MPTPRRAVRGGECAIFDLVLALPCATRLGWDSASAVDALAGLDDGAWPERLPIGANDHNERIAMATHPVVAVPLLRIRYRASGGTRSRTPYRAAGGMQRKAGRTGLAGAATVVALSACNRQPCRPTTRCVRDHELRSEAHDRSSTTATRHTAAQDALEASATMSNVRTRIERIVDRRRLVRVVRRLALRALATEHAVDTHGDGGRNVLDVLRCGQLRDVRTLITGVRIQREDAVYPG